MMGLSGCQHYNTHSIGLVCLCSFHGCYKRVFKSFEIMLQSFRKLFENVSAGEGKPLVEQVGAIREKAFWADSRRQCVLQPG